MKFASKSQVILSWKLDGLTLVLRYKDGKLDQAITRGTDGTIGEDVTHTVRTFLNVPLTIPTKDAFEVRGEGVISWDHFDLINSGNRTEAPEIWRPAARGSWMQVSLGSFSWSFSHSILSVTTWSLTPNRLSFSSWNRFSVLPYIYIDAIHEPDIIRDAIQKFDPEKFASPVDGLIMEYDDRIYCSSLGATGHHENRMIALKWEDELAETEFIGVRLATTRTGMVSITGLFKPVELGGTTVSHAYLHNLDIFNEFQFGVGDRIQVYKVAKMKLSLAPRRFPMTGQRKLSSGSNCSGCLTTATPWQISWNAWKSCTIPPGKQQRFVESIGMNPSTLSRWKRRKTRPDTYAKGQIAAYFGFESLEEIMMSFLFLGLEPFTDAQERLYCQNQIDQVDNEAFRKIYPALVKLLK